MNEIDYICNYAFQLTYWVGALLNIPKPPPPLLSLMVEHLKVLSSPYQSSPLKGPIFFRGGATHYSYGEDR